MIITYSIINGCFALLAALVPFIVGRLPDLRSASRRTRLAMLSSLILASIVGITTFFVVSHIIRSSPEAAITIPAGSPAAPASIQLGEAVAGSASNLPHDQLFLVLGSTGGGGLRYYPQAQVNDWTGTSWKAALNALPGAGSYDLMVVYASGAEARGGLRMYLQICQATATCKGIDLLPDGVETLASMPVNITAGF